MSKTVWLSVLMLGLWSGAARAQSGPRIVVFPAEGQVAGKLKKAPAAVIAALADAARATGARVEIATGSVDDAVTLAGCERKQPDCLGQVAATVDADMVVVTTVAAADSGMFVDVELGRRGAAEPVRGNWLLDGADVATIQKAAAREATALFSGDRSEPAAGPAAPKAGEAPPAVAAPAADEGPAPLARRPAEDQPSGLGRVRWYSWAAAGAGAALMTAGGVMLVGARSKQDEIDSASTTSLADFQELESLEDDAESQALTGSVLFGAGIAAAGVGVTLIILQLRSSPDEADDGVVSLAPAAFEGGAGVSLTVLGDL